MTDREGVWAVVVRVFPDGSVWVRAESGEDVALTRRQAGKVEAGEAGVLVGRGRGRRFFKRDEIGADLAASGTEVVGVDYEVTK